MIGAIENLANQMEALLTSPFLLPCEIAHYCIVIGGVKEQWGSLRPQYQPLATWLTSMTCCFGGSVLANMFCGKSPLMPLANSQSIIFATLVWWLMFYSPRSLFFNVTQWKPMSLVITVLRELIRTKKIMKGVTIARPTYPSSIFLCSIIGMLTACGGGFIQHCAIVFRNERSKDSIKTFSLSLVTKCCLLFAVLYSLQLNGSIQVTIKLIALLQVLVLSLIEILEKFDREIDPFTPIEQAASSLLITYSAFEPPPAPKPVRIKTFKYSNNSKHRKLE